MEQVENVWVPYRGFMMRVGKDRNIEKRPIEEADLLKIKKEETTPKEVIKNKPPIETQTNISVVKKKPLRVMRKGQGRNVVVADSTSDKYNRPLLLTSDAQRDKIPNRLCVPKSQTKPVVREKKQIPDEPLVIFPRNDIINCFPLKDDHIRDPNVSDCDPCNPLKIRREMVVERYERIRGMLPITLTVNLFLTGKLPKPTITIDGKPSIILRSIDDRLNITNVDVSFQNEITNFNSIYDAFQFSLGLLDPETHNIHAEFIDRNPNPWDDTYLISPKPRFVKPSLAEIEFWKNSPTSDIMLFQPITLGDIIPLYYLQHRAGVFVGKIPHDMIEVNILWKANNKREKAFQERKRLLQRNNELLPPQKPYQDKNELRKRPLQEKSELPPPKKPCVDNSEPPSSETVPNFSCGICFEPYDKEDRFPATLIGCFHSFCFTCTTKFEKQVCPVCTNKFSGIHKLFFM